MIALRKNFAIIIDDELIAPQEIFRSAIKRSYGFDPYIFKDSSRRINILFPREHFDGCIDQFLEICKNNEICREFLNSGEITYFSYTFEHSEFRNQYDRAVEKLTKSFSPDGWAISEWGTVQYSNTFFVFFKNKSDAVRFKLLF